MKEISKLLAEPESKILEIKKDLSSMQPILKTLVAFANTAGGTLIVGVAPDGKLVGLTDVLKAEEKIANAIADTIAPTLLPEIEIATINKKHVLIIKVSHWRAPFYIKKLGISKGVYIRLGSTSRPATPEIISELKRSLINQSYDQQALYDLTKSALDLKKIQEAFKAVKKEINEKKLRSLGILVPSNHKFVPSIGGLILFGKKEYREEYFPDVRLKCARFGGSNKTLIVDRHEVEGTLLDAVNDVPKFISRNTRLAAEIKKIRRKDIPEYPDIAIREILINALVHTDYSIVGSGIQIAIFDDRLEIQNPGMLPFGFTMDDLKAGVSRIRNRVIAKTFHELKLMEEWGSGYQRVVTACHEHGYQDPEWLEQGTSMRVTFFSQQRRKVQKASPRSEELTERQQDILALFKKKQNLPFREIYKHFSGTISERMLRYELAQLREKGALTPKGRGPSSLWEKS